MSDPETFADIIGREFLATMEPPSDAETTVYGCRVLFYNLTDPSQHMSRLIPWLTYDLDTARGRRAELVHSMRGTHLRAFLRYDTTVWSPMAVRVVQLAEIPF